MRLAGFAPRSPAPSRPLLHAAAAAALFAAAGAARAAPFEVTVEAPGVQSADRAALCGALGGGTCTIGVEAFDARPTGAGQAFTTDYGTGGAITGTYSGVRVARAGVSGGAGGGGKYAATYTPAGYALSLATTLPGGVNYFGYWLSALDRGNRVTFYSGAAEVYRFAPSDLIARLGACPGAANAYCGNPTPAFRGRDAGEPYAFVNFFDRAGAFDRVVFSENPTAGGYESDNHTVGYVAAGSVAAVPEPASLAALSPALAGLGLMRRRRAGKAA